MFSSDLTDEDLKRILGHVSQRKHCRVLAVFSGADEYVPPLVLENYKEFAIRLCSAMGTQCDYTIIPKASHSLHSQDATTLFLSSVSNFLE